MSETQREHKPRVAAVVLTWNDTEMTSRCVESLMASDYDQLEIVVVDNGSSPPCAPEIKRRFPEVRTVALLKNRGFTGGANRGLERALESGSDYIFFLNNDTVVDASAVSHLVQSLEERPEAGAASALLLFPGDDRTIQFYTGQVDRDLARHVHPETDLPHAGRDWPTVETDFVPACALMLRSSVLQEVGLFDESLGTNWEDYDFCLRMTNAGHRLITVGAAEVVHERHKTTGGASPYITYYFTRNRLICLSRYSDGSRLLLNAVPIARSFWWQIKRYGVRDWACHRAFARGVFDFLVGVRGEGHPPGAQRRRGPGPSS